MVIDEHGRLFGRVNLIDALVGVVALALIPLAFGAFLLFHVPAPTITSVTPTRVAANQPIVLVLTGTNLRTYMRVYLGAVLASEVKFDELGRVRAVMPVMAAGTYDLVLADEAQELLRVPHAVTVVAPQPTMATVKVRFVALPEVLKHLMPGDRDTQESNATGESAAVVIEIGSEREPVAAVIHDNVLGRIVQTPQPMVRFMATLRVPVFVTPSGASYHGLLVKPGGQFLFESPSGAMAGVVQDVQTPPLSPSTE